MNWKISSLIQKSASQLSGLQDSLITQITSEQTAFTKMIRLCFQLKLFSPILWFNPFLFLQRLWKMVIGHFLTRRILQEGTWENCQNYLLKPGKRLKVYLYELFIGHDPTPCPIFLPRCSVENTFSANTEWELGSKCQLTRLLTVTIDKVHNIILGDSKSQDTIFK